MNITLSKRQVLLIALALHEHETHGIGDPLGRADSRELQTFLLRKLDAQERFDAAAALATGGDVGAELNARLDQLGDTIKSHKQ